MINTDTSILSNITTVTLARLITPITTTSSSYTINFNNAFFNPHSGHSTIIASTGFFINNTTATEYFFDDDGEGNLRVYSLVGGVRTYLDSEMEQLIM